MTTTIKSPGLAILTATLALAANAINWDQALITGTTPNGKIFYEPNEEMTFTLRLEGVREPLPANTYFVDWQRRGDDGLVENGRAPLPFADEGLVLKTKLAKPGFVCIEANVVTADGKRVPKNHRWEKRVFFQGGAGVRPGEIPMAAEPADYDRFWADALKELDQVPMNATMTPLTCKDDAVNLFAVSIPCAGGYPVTGYLTIPKAASATNRMPISANYRGASEDEQLPPSGGPHNRISMLINPNGYELGRGKDYVKKFFREVAQPGYGYGMGPKQNEKKETSYWKYCALRAIRYLQWLKTRPEWNGKDLDLGGGSQGDWQCYHAAAHVPGVTRINGNGSWGCDWTGQSTLGRLKSTYRPGCWFADMAYFDPVFAAKRISCPVSISFAGLGDYCSTPASLTLVYRNLKGPKRITYVQGSTHGWRPAGQQRWTVDGGFDSGSPTMANSATDRKTALKLLESKEIVYWLDAKRSDTIERDATGGVLAWRSANGNGYAFKAEGAKAKATGSGQPIRFTSSKGQMRLSGSGEATQRTVFLAIRPRKVTSSFMGAWGARNYDMGLRTAQESRAWENVLGGPDFNSTDSILVNGSPVHGAAPFREGEMQIIALRHTADLSLWGSKGKTTFTPALGGYIGGRGFEGDIAEAIAFSRLLSVDECQALSAMLVEKWLGEDAGDSDDPLDAIREAVAKGEKKIRVSKRLYCLKPKDRGVYLRLKALKDVDIDFAGSELRGLVNTGFFHLEDCTNVTIRNVTLDYKTLPFTQARIVAAEPGGVQIVETLAGYPAPAKGVEACWPFQVYDQWTLELKNPMRMGAGFKVEWLADGRYRVSGGNNRAGCVGDYAVWGMPSPKGAIEGDHVAERDAIHSRQTVGCVFENITEYATPGGRAFEEHLSEGNVYRNCRIIRRAAEDDFAPRAVRRLRSGNHDAFMSRRAVVGPKLLGCTALYHCDDAVNISGMYGVVYETKGNEVRLLEYTPTVFHPGDETEAMTQDGVPVRAGRVTAFRRGGDLSAEEKAYMKTIGLWGGLADLCRTSSFVTLDDAAGLKRGDALISKRAEGNGFEIRGCHFGRNRAFGIRLRASHGRITDNVIDRPEGCAIYVGPEYEWLEGGLSKDVTIADNVFIGCNLSIAGSAAHRKRLPRGAYEGLVVSNNTVTANDASEARLDPLGHIRREIARGAKSIRLPKARYWLTLPGGRQKYLALENLSNLTIDCGGSEFIGNVKASMFALSHTTNVTIRNVAIDYSDLPFTQAVIEKIDDQKNWTCRVIPGYPKPAQRTFEEEGVWPVQVYDKTSLELKNPMRFRNQLKITRISDDTYLISGGQNRRGDVGDIAVWSLRETDRGTQRGAVNAAFASHCLFEDIRIYSTPHGCAYAEYTADANTYRRCTIERRPAATDLFPRGLRRLRSGNHDAFNSRCSITGPLLDGCVFQYHCDDCVNISGFYAFVMEANGRILRTAPYGGSNRIEAGDTCQLMTYEGQCLKDAKVLSVTADGDTTEAERKFFADYNLWPGIAAGVRRIYRVELDREVALPRGSVIISNRRMGNGFVIRNCRMGHNRARGLLIKASDGIMENNTLEGTEGDGIQVSPECEWMEGGCSQNLIIRGNRIRNNGGGILVAGNNGARKPLPPEAHHNIVITNNVVTGGGRGITVVGCKGLNIKDNEITIIDIVKGKVKERDLRNVIDVQQ